MSELEQILREIIEKAQRAQTLSWEYPNPYAGIPSPITQSIIQVQRWAKDALSEVIAVDLDTSEDKHASGFSMQTRHGLTRKVTGHDYHGAPTYESGDDDQS